jgi:NTE family protein
LSGLAPGSVPAGPDFAVGDGPDGAPGFPCDAGGDEEVGLALSGGGIRATLFHLGALIRLRELGWLERLDRISGVSGGSIMAAVLARAWASLKEARFSPEAFATHVTGPVLSFAGQRIDVWVIALGLVPGISPARLLAARFERDLTHGMRLAQLPDRPRFVFNAATLGTGVSWRFEKPYMADSRLGAVCDPDLPLAHAVAASAAFPPFVAPFELDLRDHELRPMRGADLFADPAAAALRRRVLLLDGGAYDNLAIEPVEGRCRIALASDAGGNLRVDARTWRYQWWWPLIRRTLDLAVEGGRAQRRRALVDRTAAARELPDEVRSRLGLRTQHVALWRTSLRITGHRLMPEGWVVAPGWERYIAARPTRLSPMSHFDRDHVVNWGYLTSDLMLRSWVPELENAPAPTDLPFPDATFEAPPPA